MTHEELYAALDKLSEDAYKLQVGIDDLRDAMLSPLEPPTDPPAPSPVDPDGDVLLHLPGRFFESTEDQPQFNRALLWPDGARGLRLQMDWDGDPPANNATLVWVAFGPKGKPLWKITPLKLTWRHKAKGWRLVTDGGPNAEGAGVQLDSRIEVVVSGSAIGLDSFPVFGLSYDQGWSHARAPYLHVILGSVDTKDEEESESRWRRLECSDLRVEVLR